ncbi:hypothetical protein KCP74_20165 [Salmonella enterica subsp. enterica]|nr:hypothetical protein KCP74_20165 [Salmonella enterica subsp. enterica]
MMRTFSQNAFNGTHGGQYREFCRLKGYFRSSSVFHPADLAKWRLTYCASKLLGSVPAMFGFGTSAGGSTPTSIQFCGAVGYSECGRRRTVRQDSASTAALLIARHFCFAKAVPG